MTTRVNASGPASMTVARGAVLPSLFFGRRVETLRGLDLDPTQKRGYRRLFKRHQGVNRPGAYTPKVTRTYVPQGASTVGTTTVLGALDEMKAGCASRGVAGSRQPWTRSIIPPAGPVGNKVSLSATPAFGVFETAYARTGVPVLYSKFAAPAGQVPNGLTRFDPIPAYTRVPMSGIVPGPTPVGCLPGTPGCYADPTARNVGFRLPWWRTQNEGQFSSPVMTNDSPLPPDASDGGSPLSPANGDIYLPIAAPGTQHSIDATGGVSYVGEPGYPNYTSPFGYTGSDRPGATPPMPSGHDAPLKRHEQHSIRGAQITKIFVGLGVAAGLIHLTRRRSR